MRLILFTVIFFAILNSTSCITGGPFLDSKQIIGKWTITSYTANGDEINEEDKFNFTEVHIKKQRDFNSGQFYVWRQTNSCNQPFPIGLSFLEESKNMKFSVGTICDTLNKISPFFYPSQLDTTGYIGDWNVTFINNRLMFIDNKGISPDSPVIEMQLEKKK